MTIKGRKLKPNCTGCGVLKTPENTYTTTAGTLRNVCKVCYSKKYRSTLSTEALQLTRAQHVAHIEEIDAILNQREDSL